MSEIGNDLLDNQQQASIPVFRSKDKQGEPPTGPQGGPAPVPAQLDTTHDRPQRISRHRVNLNIQRERELTGFSWALTEHLPEKELKARVIAANEMTFGRKLSKGEQIKVYREFKKKKKAYDKAQSVKREWDEWSDHIDSEFLDDKYQTDMREEWNAVKLFDTAEERRDFMDGMVSEDMSQKAAQIDLFLQKFEALYADKAKMKQFEFKSIDDMNENFVEKMRWVKAGFGLRKMAQQFVNAGGYLTRERYLKINEMADVFEGIQVSYSYAEVAQFSPANLVLRDKYMQQLTDQNKFADFMRNFASWRAPDGLTEDQSKRMDTARAMMVEFINKNVTEYIPSWKGGNDSRGYPNFSKGIDMDTYIEGVKKRRLEREKENWSEGLDTFMSQTEELSRIMGEKSLYEDHKDMPVIRKDPSLAMGNYLNRDGDRAAIVNLIMMHRENQKEGPKAMSFAQMQENGVSEEQKAERYEIEREIVDTFNAQEVDKEKVADLIREAIRGMMEQFSVVKGQGLFNQVGSINSMFCGDHKLWGKRFALLKRIASCAATISQLLEKSPDSGVQELVFRDFTQADFKLIDGINHYLWDVGAATDRLYRSLETRGLQVMKNLIVAEDAKSKRDEDRKFFDGMEEYLSGFHEYDALNVVAVSRGGEWSIPKSYYTGSLLAGTDSATRSRMVQDGSAKATLDAHYNDMKGTEFYFGRDHKIDYSGRPER